MACRYCGRDIGHAFSCPAYVAPKETGPKVRYSGTEFEYDMFDEVNVRDPKFLDAMRELGAQENGYLPYAKAVELAKRFQPGDPTNPRKGVMNDLLIEVQDRLGVDPESGALRAYTAVGTPLDKFHGVDAFIALKDTDGRDVMVTMDATLREDKLRSGHKADVMVGELPAPEEDEDAYLEAIEGVAEELTKRLDEQRHDDHRRTG